MSRPIYTMERVIELIQAGSLGTAKAEFQTMTACHPGTAGQAVEALCPYVDPSHPEYAKPAQRGSEAIPGDISAEAWSKAFGQVFEAIPEPSQDRVPINKWMVTGTSPNGLYWQDFYGTAENAEESAKIICKEGYANVTISQVIAEAKTIYTISL